MAALRLPMSASSILLLEDANAGEVVGCKSHPLGNLYGAQGYAPVVGILAHDRAISTSLHPAVSPKPRPK